MAAGSGAEIARHVHDFLCSYAPAHLTSSENTLRGYRTALSLYMGWLDGLGVTPSTLAADDFSQPRIEGWLEWLAEERGCSPQTCNVRLSSVRVFLAYVSRHDVSLAHLEGEAARVPKRKAPRRHVEGLTRDAVRALLAPPDQSTRGGRRDLALMVLLYATGARVGEVLGMRCSRLDLDGPSPHALVTGKGNKQRVLHLPEKAVTHMRAYVREYHGEHPDPEAYVFFSRNGGPGVPLSQDAVAKMLRKHAASARETCPEVPARPHAHQFRHARASHWLEDGMNVVQVSFLLGHASVATTMAYLDVTIDSKAAAMDGVGAPAQEKRWKGKGATLREFCGLSGQ